MDLPVPVAAHQQTVFADCVGAFPICGHQCAVPTGDARPAVVVGQYAVGRRGVRSGRGHVADGRSRVEVEQSGSDTDDAVVRGQQISVHPARAGDAPDAHPVVALQSGDGAVGGDGERRPVVETDDPGRAKTRLGEAVAGSHEHVRFGADDEFAVRAGDGRGGVVVGQREAPNLVASNLDARDAGV